MPRPTSARLGREAVLLMAMSGIYSISHMGVQALLKVLYILRLGHGPEYVGLFGAAGALAYMAMSLPAGLLGERFGARRVMLVAGTALVLAMCLFPLTPLLPPGMQAAWPIMAQMLATMSWSVLNVNVVPALMLATTERNRAGAFATANALRSLGTLLGTVVGGLLPGLFGVILGQGLDLPAPYAYGLWVGAALGLLGLVPIALIKSDAPQAVAERARPATSSSGQAAPAPFALVPLVFLALHVFLTHGGWATAQAFINAYMDTDLRLSSSAIGLLTGLAQGVACLAAFATPRLTARLGVERTLILGAASMALCLLPLALIPHWAAATVGRVGVLALDAVWLPALQLFQMEQVAPQWRARAYGLQSMVMGGCFALVSLGGGVLSAAMGYRSVFLVGVGLCGAGAAVRWLATQGTPAGRNRGYTGPSDAPRGPGVARGARK